MKNILLIRFSALGDVAMLAPVVREVARENGDAEFTVLSRPMCEPLFENIGENVHFIGRDVKKDYNGLKGLYRLFRELDQMHFDCVCDMHDVLRTKVLRKFFRLHGYKVYKINKHRELRKVITAEGDKKKLIQLPTAFENYQSVLKECGLNDNSNLNHNEMRISRNAELSTKKVGIAPFAAHQGKIYPLERMEEVVRMILCNDIAKNIILFGGGGEERAKMQEWADKYPNVHLASEYCKNLREELQLMKSLDVMLTMDSANMHLASLVGTRVVSIWGATHPYAGFLGWGQSMDDSIQRNDLKCRPCSIYGNKPCLRGDMACMDIAPEIISCKVQDL
jgi:ADP-heptose:LPS heptosyltransferase